MSARRLFLISPFHSIILSHVSRTIARTFMLSFCMCCTLPVPLAVRVHHVQTTQSVRKLSQPPPRYYFSAAREWVWCTCWGRERTGKRHEKLKTKKEEEEEKNTTNWFVAMVLCWVVAGGCRAHAFIWILHFWEFISFRLFTLAASLCVHSALPHIHKHKRSHIHFSLISCCFAAFMLCRSSLYGQRIWCARILFGHFGKNI